MTVPQFKRRWPRLLPGLLPVIGLVAFVPAAVATPLARPAPPPVTLTWSTVSPPATPPSLAFASAVYDSDSKTVVLFGGAKADGALSNDTWVWNGTTWTDYPGSQVQAPPAREMASMAFDPKLHQLILFGGEGGGASLLDDTWAWNGASWYDETSSFAGPGPGPRADAAMAYDGAGDLVLFGGFGGVGVGVGRVGGASTAMLGDTWLWTASGWQAATTPGPPARSGAALAFEPAANVAVLFGGESTPVHSRFASSSADTWAWNGQGWHRLVPAASPPGRHDAGLVSDASTGGLVLFGGSGAGGDLSDAWVWNGRNWASARTAGSLSPRVGAAAAFDAATSRVLAFGGAGPQGAILDDTVLLGQTAPIAISGGAGSGSSSSSTSTQLTGSSTLPAGSSRKTGRGAPASTPTSTGPGHPGLPLAHLTPLRPLHRGDLVTLSGTSFEAGTSVTIWFLSQPVVVGKAVANSRGDFTVTVPVPGSASNGIHRFEASGQGRTGPISELIATVRIAAAPGSDLTSSTLQRVVLTAIAVLIPGATWMALVAMGRVRRRKAAIP